MNTPSEQGAGAQKQRLVTPTFVLSWLVNFGQYLLFYLLITTVALYAVKEFAASETASGLAASSFVIGATIARMFAGYVSDTLGRRPVLIVAAVVVTVSCALYIPADSFSLLVIVRVFHGAGYALASTAVMAIVQSTMPPLRRAEGTGYFALSSTLATAVGPAVGLFLVTSFTYDVLFAVTLVTAILSLVLALFVRKPAAQREAEAAKETLKRPRFTWTDIAHPAVIPIGLFMLFVGVCYSGVITYLNAYAEVRDVVTGAGLFFIAYAVVMLLLRFVLGRVQDRRGDNIVIYLGLVSFALALVILSVADSDWQVVLAGALTGMGFGTLMPACQAIAVSLVPTEKLGIGISTMFLFTDVGSALGPILLGGVIAATGYGSMYALLAGVAVVAGIFYYAVHGRLDVAKPRSARR